jgi:hypothetical protein
MQSASRTYVLAAAALAATGVAVVLPTAPRPAQPSQPPVRHMDTRLVDFTDVPINLFDDIANIPFNEIQGIDVMGNSLLFSGDWWVPSATNIWGTDPGDPGHYMGILDMLLPFAPQISGLGQPEIDPTLDANGTAGLAQQIALLAAAELPVSSSCDAQSCGPMTPPEVITGSTAWDRDIGFFEALNGKATDSNGEPFGLFSHWFQVPLSDLTNGFTFTPATDPGLQDPSPDVGPNAPGVTGSLGFPGTTGVDGTGTGTYMPWAGDTFKLNLFGPFESYWNSLLATPSTSGIGGTGIELPTSTNVLDAFQNLTAGSIVAFDPYVAGSPACPANCDLPASETQLALLHDVLAWDPSNTTLANYVNDFAAQNNATQPEINDAIALLQTGAYNFSPTELAQVDTALGNINPELPALFTNSGIITDPAYLTYISDPSAVTDPSTGFIDSAYGGYNPNLEFSDFLTMLQDAGTHPVDPTLSTDLQTLATDFAFPGDPANLQSVLEGGGVVAPAAATGAAGLSTDLSAILASLGSTAGTDLLSQMISEIGTQLAADFGSQVPTDLLSMF